MWDLQLVWDLHILQAGLGRVLDAHSGVHEQGSTCKTFALTARGEALPRWDREVDM